MRSSTRVPLRDSADFTRQHTRRVPYEAGVLTIALLIEGEHFSPSLSSEIGAIARRALDGESEDFEAFTIATLSLAQRLHFRSLANLAKLPTSLSDWSDIATMFRALSRSHSATLCSPDDGRSSKRLFTFLSNQPITGVDDVSYALSFGSGGLDYLLETISQCRNPVLHSKHSHS